MAGRKITGPILGVVDLDFEVTLKVRNKKTGAENQYYYPNVGAIQTDHIRTADTEGMRSLAVTGMPQALLLIMGFNASLQTGRTVEIKDCGALQGSKSSDSIKGEGTADDNTEEG